MKDHSDHNYEHLCWLDLETTGLDADLDAILEIGIVITTKSLDVVASKSWVVNTNHQPDLKVRDIDAFVWKMHLSNGLWMESLSSEINLEFAIYDASRFVIENKAQGSPLCGSTISFDRGFLKAQAPELLRTLHYRNLDVSTLKLMMQIHFPFESPFNKTAGDHRVISDLEASIAEYRHYIDFLKGRKL